MSLQQFAIIGIGGNSPCRLPMSSVESRDSGEALKLQQRKELWFSAPPILISVSASDGHCVTNGGKSMLSTRLCQQLPNVHVLNMDHYYWPVDSPHHVMLSQFDYANWEVPSAVDFVRLLADTERWIEMVQNRSPDGQHILLVEGILIYSYRPLLQYFNKKYAFTLSLQECRKRRRQRRYVPPDPEDYFDAIVWPHYLENSALIAQQNYIVYLDGSVDSDVTFQQVLTDIKLLFKQ